MLCFVVFRSRPPATRLTCVARLLFLVTGCNFLHFFALLKKLFPVFSIKSALFAKTCRVSAIAFHPPILPSYSGYLHASLP
jgi:hypothetical protein